MVVSLHVTLGIEPESSGKAANEPLNHPFSPTSIIINHREKKKTYLYQIEQKLYALIFKYTFIF